MTTLRVALWQADTIWEDPEANRQKAREAIARAAREGARIVALPEVFATGFTMAAEQWAEPIPGTTSEFLSQCAREHRIHVVGSAIEAHDRPRNTAFVIDPEGDLRLVYRKIHPFSYGKESEHYEGGTELHVTEVEGVTVGLQICYDLRFPETFRALIDRGAEVIFVVANWPVKRARHWSCLLEARALENLVAVCGVNRTGSDPLLTYPGLSAVHDHQGVALARAGAEETLLFADIDLAALRKWREQFPALRDRRPEVYEKLSRG